MTDLNLRAVGRSQNYELVFTILMAIAAVATAWAGFQSAKWNGEQALATAEASALRTDSTRAATVASTHRTLDTIAFAEWIGAMYDDIRQDPATVPDGSYAPREGTRSAFIYARFRPEFIPAFHAWIASRPLQDPQAPTTPFIMEQYRLATEVQEFRLIDQADRAADRAQMASQRVDDYVLFGVFFALVLFFCALGLKARNLRTELVLLSISSVGLVATLAVLAARPVLI